MANEGKMRNLKMKISVLKAKLGLTPDVGKRFLKNLTPKEDESLRKEVC